MLLSRKGVAAGYYSPYKPVRIIFYTYQVTFIYITCDDKLIVVRNISDLFFGAGSSRAVTVGTALAILVCAGSCWAITVGSALAILLSASSRWAIAVSTALSVVLCHCCKLLSSDQICSIKWVPIVSILRLPNPVDRHQLMLWCSDHIKLHNVDIVKQARLKLRSLHSHQFGPTSFARNSLWLEGHNPSTSKGQIRKFG
jgi:hypothetical protein